MRVLSLVFGILLLAACQSEQADPPSSSAEPPETGFEELQERGEVAMGVDQNTSTHLFDVLPDGGRIELQRDVEDPEGVATIREHLREIVVLFQAGDFRIPGFVHDQTVPGTMLMAEKRDVITYTYSDLPRGGEVRITTEDPYAIDAIRLFMEFQRQDHRAGGHGH